jgi:hypothetical protein
VSRGRIVFEGNPWPEGHAVEAFEWSARFEDGEVWFDLHLASAAYYAEREIEEDEDEPEDDSWKSPSVWGNYHRCTLSSTFWGEHGGFRAGPLAQLSAAALDGAEFVVDPVGEEIDDVDELAFGLYLLGHDSAVEHRIRFLRRGDSERFDILWSGRIALTYVGRYRPDYRFQARIEDVPMPTPRSP